MTQRHYQTISEAFSEKWIQQTATDVIRDLQRDLNLREALPARRHESPWRLPTWCFDVAESSIQQDDIDFWDLLCKHPPLLGGAIATWARQSGAIRACSPVDIERLGLLPDDVREFVLQLVIQSQALRTFVLEVTTAVVGFLRREAEDVSFLDCDRAVRRAGSACRTAFMQELECFAVIELPGLVRERAPGSQISLAFVRAPILIPDFPTHSRDVDSDCIQPFRTIVSRDDSTGPGCVAVVLVDDAWQIRPDHTARLDEQRSLLKAERARDEGPPPEAYDAEPIRRPMRLSDLTIEILVSGAPAFARSASELAEQSVRGVLESLDFGLLSQPTDRKHVFASILSARPGQDHRHAKRHPGESRRPSLLRTPKLDIAENFDFHWPRWDVQNRLGAMEAEWNRHMQSVSVGIDESALKAMLEVCVVYPDRSKSDQRLLNPIAKAFREIHRASCLRTAHPGDSLVVAMTAIESTLLRKDSKADNKTAILSSRIVRLFDCDREGVSEHVTDWFKCLYDIRSRIVHGDVVDEAEVRRQECATLFLASACLLRVCTRLRFAGRLGLSPTNESCLAALRDFLASLDDPKCADTRAEHVSLGRWPAQLFARSG